MQVFVRIKPTDNFATEAIELLPDEKSLNIHAEKDKRRGYINNQILDWNFSTSGVLHNASQEEVYSNCCAELVKRTLDGYNSTIFAYGETGGGKTYSMTGTVNNFQHRGIIPRALTQLFAESEARHEQQITVRVSYLEIYKEEIFDLLNTLPGTAGNKEHPTEMSVTEDEHNRIQIKGLSHHTVVSEEEALNLMFEGDLNRVISEHRMNKRSSRSHCIFTIHVESHSRTESNTKFTMSKLNLVDLAGSERLKKTESCGETEVEAMHINQSLTFLEQAAIALEDRNREHVPFRQSKLTHVLKDALGGRCHTVMLANIWGEQAHIEETLSTLRFASRVMNIPCEPAVNHFVDPMRLAREYEREITCLRQELAMYDTLTNRTQVSYEPLSDVQIADVRSDVSKFVDDPAQEISIVNLRQTREVFRQFRELLIATEESVEERLREKYTLFEKGKEGDKGTETGYQPQERVGQVGEPDGHGFAAGKPGLGVKPAQPSAVGTSRKKKQQQLQRPKDSATERKPSAIERRVSVQSPVPSGAKLGAASDDNIADVVGAMRPGTPPSKDEAFEQYKRERGQDLNQVLADNKEILRDKVKELRRLTAALNSTKHQIDAAKENLALERSVKESGEEERSGGGEPILDEGEFNLLQQLQGLKQSYRRDHQRLSEQRQDVSYCDALVAQCRDKLLTEFDEWYREAFGCQATNTTAAGQEATTSALSPPQDDQVSTHPVLKYRPHTDANEKFDAVCTHTLLQNPGSVSFYNARMQTEKRRLLHHGTMLPKIHASRRNTPPNTLVVQS